MNRGDRTVPPQRANPIRRRQTRCAKQNRWRLLYDTATEFLPVEALLASLADDIEFWGQVVQSSKVPVERVPHLEMRGPALLNFEPPDPGP